MLELCPAGTLSQTVSSHFDDPELSDVVISFPDEGKELHVHQFILASQSDVFKKMLHSQMKEGIQRKITFGSEEKGKLKYDLVKKALHFLYFAPIYCTDVDECLELMEFAHQFLLMNLFAVSVEAIKPKVCEENVLLILEFARKYESKDLEGYCWKFVEASAAELIKTEEFLELDEETISDFLERNVVAEEISLFESILEWGKKKVTCTESQDQATAEQLPEILKRLLPSIRFPLIEKHYLITKIKPLNLIPSELYIEALEFIALGSEAKVLIPCNKRFQRRYSPTVIPEVKELRASVGLKKHRFR